VTATAPHPAPAVDPIRRYTLLSFLQWLPVGLMMVPMVLLLLERGFTLAEVAFIGAVSSITVAVLEQPTGGLADVVGRRPVFIVSALAHMVALVILGLAASMALLLVSAGLRGLARALSTGPYEAWYVDAAKALKPDEDDTAHLTSGLARGEMAGSVALGLARVARAAHRRHRTCGPWLCRARNGRVRSGRTGGRGGTGGPPEAGDARSCRRSGHRAVRGVPGAAAGRHGWGGHRRRTHGVTGRLGGLRNRRRRPLGSFGAAGQDCPRLLSASRTPCRTANLITQ
jgi:hypothetical protein